MDMTPDTLETATTILPTTATDPTMASSTAEAVHDMAVQQMMSIFRDNYKITLEDLSIVSEGSQSQEFSPTQYFYLHSCANQDAEAQRDREFLEAWLRQNAPIKIFSDWGQFVNGCPRGVIMVCIL